MDVRGAQPGRDACSRKNCRMGPHLLSWTMSNTTTSKGANDEKKLEITVHKHRGKPSFRWFVNGKARYRIIQDLTRIQSEEVQLRVELVNGTTKKIIEQRQKTLADMLRIFIRIY